MTPDLIERITEYLSSGGLYNPEAMNHDTVRALLMDCRDHARAQQAEMEKLRAALKPFAEVGQKCDPTWDEDAPVPEELLNTNVSIGDFWDAALAFRARNALKGEG